MPALSPSRASTLHDTTARSDSDANRGRDRTQISVGRWDSTAYRQSAVGSPEVESLVSDQLSHFLPEDGSWAASPNAPSRREGTQSVVVCRGFRRSRSTAQ